MYLQFTILAWYFIMLFSIMIAVRNVDYIANHPRTEQLVNKIRYNLRDIPRVNYKEDSSEEEIDEYYEDIDSEEEKQQNAASEEAEAEPVEENDQEVRHRRERGAFGRILDEVLN